MADVVDLRTRQPTSHDDEFNAQLVQDLARFAEGLVTEKDIKRRYRFDESTWESLNNDALIAAVEDEKTRRVRSGALKRERAQALVTSAPGVLGEILLAKDANPRHRIDAAKALDDFSVDKPEAAAAMTDRFIINIVLNADGAGGDTLTFNKRITPLAPGEVDPDDVDPNDTGLIAAIAAKKTENGGGEPL